MDLILKPIRAATSRPARQTYLNSFLFMIASSILFGLAVVAYVLFYIEYIPQVSVERVVHLQYGDGPHPYGIERLDPSIVPYQAYDISLSLHVPRSPTNLATGNFMLSLSVLAQIYTPPSPSVSPPSIHNPSIYSKINPSSISYTTRRTALIPYRSYGVSLLARLISMPLYLFGLKHESEILTIPMSTVPLIFPKDFAKIPIQVLLEIQASSEVQVYDVRVYFTARFSRLRWLMYNYRIFSFAIFTTAFWIVEMTFAILGWVGLRTYLAPKKEGVKDEPRETVKDEDTDEMDLSDVPKTAPHSGGPLTRAIEDSDESDLDEMGLRAVKMELEGGEMVDEKTGTVGSIGGSIVSGVGTSFSEGSGNIGLSRRRSKGGHAGG